MIRKESMYPLVTVAIPFSRNLTPDWVTAWTSMWMQPPHNAMVDFRRTINAPRDEARDHLSQGALERKSKFCQMIDDDVTVPGYIIRKLLYAFQNQPPDVGVIAGIYCSKTVPAIPLVFQKSCEGAFYEWKLEEVFECEVVPTGMMMFRTEMLEKISKPWFKDLSGVKEAKMHGIIPGDVEMDDFTINDDGYFCHKVREAGYRVMAHGGVLGIHWDTKGTAYLLPDNAYPIRMEMEKRYGNMSKKSDAERIAAYKAIVSEYYGHADLLFPNELEEAQCITTPTQTK